MIETSNEEEKVISTSQSDTLMEQVSLDIERVLSQFKDSKKGLRVIALKTNIHEKTLARILRKENKPSYITVFRLYRFLLDEYNDSKVLEFSPPAVKEYLQKSNPQTLDKHVSYTTEIDSELVRNSVFADLYILAGTGEITKKQILKRFGENGINILNKMLNLETLKEIRPEVFVLGTNQASFSPEVILKVGINLIENYAKPHDGDVLNQNFSGLYAEGLSEEGYKEWLSIDQEAFKKKVALSQNKAMLGQKKAFTFMITENMNTEDK